MRKVSVKPVSSVRNAMLGEVSIALKSPMRIKGKDPRLSWIKAATLFAWQSFPEVWVEQTCTGPQGVCISAQEYARVEPAAVEEVPGLPGGNGKPAHNGWPLFKVHEEGEDSPNRLAGEDAESCWSVDMGKA